MSAWFFYLDSVSSSLIHNYFFTEQLVFGVAKKKKKKIQSLLNKVLFQLEIPSLQLKHL